VAWELLRCCLCVERFLRKYLWTLDATVVAICAALLGAAASGFVESRLPLMSAPKGILFVAVHPKADLPARSKKPDAILRRNVFCSKCPPIRLDGDPEPAPVVDDVAPVQPKATSLPLKLLAVMYSAEFSEREWNTAVIRDMEAKTVGAYRAGGELHGATLTTIQDTRVFLDNGGKLEFLDLFAAPTPPPPPKRPAPILSAVVDPLSQELDRGIKKLGEHRYELRRSTVDSVLGNVSLLARSARIIPDVRGGKAHGFRMMAVKPDGPFAKIGIQNGDVLVSINGLEMSSPEKALEVYAKLKSANHLSLGVERMGKRIEQDYSVH
jgi:general secretion pathway protein C